MIFNTLNNRNVSTDIIYTLDDLKKYKVVIIPHMAIADEAFEQRLQEFADKGGIVILSAKSGTKDKNAQYRPIKNPGVFRKIAGCCVKWFTSLPEHAEQFVEMSGKRYPVSIYYEALQIEKGTIQATYTEDFCAGKTAIVKNGNVYYLGFFCKESAEIYYDIIRDHIDSSDPTDENLEEAILGEYKMYLNHGNRAVKVSGYDLLKECRFDEIEPYGVALVDVNS